jgi:hypothetical protein
VTRLAGQPAGEPGEIELDRGERLAELVVKVAGDARALLLPRRLEPLGERPQSLLAGLEPSLGRLDLRVACSSALAMTLKARASSPISPWRGSSATRAERSPVASWRVARASPRMPRSTKISAPKSPAAAAKKVMNPRPTRLTRRACSAGAKARSVSMPTVTNTPSLPARGANAKRRRTPSECSIWRRAALRWWDAE